MNIYDSQSLLVNMYPEKAIQFGYDDSCVQIYEINSMAESADASHYIQYNKLKAEVEDVDQPIYIPISPHRESKSWAEMKVILQNLIAAN